MLSTWTNKTQQLFHFMRGRRICFDLSPYQQVLKKINSLESTLTEISERELHQQAQSMIQNAELGNPLRSMLPKVFALGREISKRSLKLRHYDEQIMAGIALHEGSMVEMQTGEGKTLAVVLPAILNALTRQGLHIVTFNDYLARRDAGWMGPIYQAFGLSVGYIQEGMSTEDRRQAYACDITYGTAREIGFDYLRDNLCRNIGGGNQQKHHVVFVDEADSILIDEARIPLVIAGSVPSEAMNLYDAAEIVKTLKQDMHFEIDENHRNIFLTDEGITVLENSLRCGPLHNPENFERLTRINLALQAEYLMSRDKDYIVRDQKIELVDEFTGRVALNRQWPHGLQTALEAKEGLETHPQGMILNSIILVHFLQNYTKVAGMTATAQPAAEEFYDFYKLKTVVIPPHKVCIRQDLPDRIFPTKAEKTKALITEIKTIHGSGRPILVGTGSIQESETLATQLQSAGIPCQVLNAKNDEEEAAIVAEAGALRTVTISTNMAGRGTDIKLGGSRAYEADQIRSLGGLHVIGTHRFESRRIDNQLRGRAGRQGDPGSSQFFVSLEDDLIERYGLVDCITSLRSHKQEKHRLAGKEIARTQRIIEDQNFQIRKLLWKYSYLLEQHREVIFKRRNELVHREKTPNILQKHVPERYEQLRTTVSQAVIDQSERDVSLYHIDRTWSHYIAEIEHLRAFVHIRSLDGCDPLTEFHKAIAPAFREMQVHLNDSILETLSTIAITPTGIDLDKAGLRTPSATWTYIINDNPLGGWSERLKRSIKQSLKKHLK